LYRLVGIRAVRSGADTCMPKEGALAEVERCYAAFQSQYQHQNHGAACDWFVQAVTTAPEVGFRYFMTRASGAVDECARLTRRATELADWLGGLLAGHPDMHVLVDYDPGLIRRIVDLREANIAKGLPSIAVITQVKSASVPVANIFNSGFNLPSLAYSLVTEEVIGPWARDYARGGACYATHLEPKPRSVERLRKAGIDKVIVHVRDPRQSVLSMIHHVTMYPDQRVALARSGFESLPVSDRLRLVMDFYFGRIQWLWGWMEAEAELNILFSTFEDFVRDRKAFIRRYIDSYGGHEEHFSWENATVAHARVDQHFRLGRVDEWREVLPRKDAEFLTACLPKSIRERFGWPD
jgi:hypothetical protein